MANHLKNEFSPYLQQHANDPIAWYPWGEEALTKARTEQKPIFLSIGYSSCHWCRVMAEESFGEEAIATILNREFISIMVDKEERPDLDSYFQAIYRIMNGSEGGWPTSLFLSDHLKPFYSATYIPDEPKYAMMSFSSLLEVITHKYTHEKKTLLTEANRVLAQLHPKKESIQATKLDRSIVDRYRIQAQGLFDQQAGGFSTSPKFPQTTTLSTLLDIYTLTQDTSTLEMVEMTLKAMAQGGLRDSIDGGFYRYTTDEAWRDPHFEKMTYDQAHLSDLYLQAYHTTQDPFYRNIAFETLEFMLEKMSDDGLFYTASNQHTQAYASLTAQEARHAFDKAKIPTKAHDALIEALHLGVESSILRVDTQHAQTLPYYPEAHQALKALRATRDYPAIDTKIILSWSAMMTTSLLKASHLEPRYLTPALHALDQLLTTFYHNDTLFHTTIRGETPTIEAFLEDYAYLSETLLYAYEVTSDEVFLITATKLLNSAIEQYYLAGRWRVTQGEFETYATLLDSPYTSPVAIVLQALQALSVLVDPVYLKFVFKTLEFHSYDLMRQPISTPAMSQTVIGYLQGERVLKL